MNAGRIPLHVLIVDDEENISKTLRLSLQDAGCTSQSASSVATAVAKLEQSSFDLVLTDFRMGGQTGLDLIRRAKTLAPDALLVVMTAFASFPNAVEVIKEGAFDYLPKPFTNEQLLHLLGKVRTIVALKRENAELKQGKARRDYFTGFTSPAMRRLEEFVRKVAPTDGTVLLLGESGTGKSELAKLIHELSPRARGPFVTVQCTSLAESLIESELFGHVKGAFTGATQDRPGKLEVAHGGTLFLDEIGDVSLPSQAKLLRFLQDRVFQRVGAHDDITVDTRVIAATNRNLEETVKEGRFREDLYYRLNALEYKLVSLRFRKEDLPILIKKLAPKSADVPKAVMDRLVAYHWPGNVRELRNVIDRLVMLCQGNALSVSDLPDSLLKPPAPAEDSGAELPSLEEMERKHIILAMQRESNLEKVAKRLGITTVTLWRKRKEYGLD